MASASSSHFLGSHNAAQVKRNVLASFANVLLLPVTIVPRTVGAVGAALTTGGTAAVQGIAMLNPQRWGGSGSNGYSRHFEGRHGQALFERGDKIDAEEKDVRPKSAASREYSFVRFAFASSLSAVSPSASSSLDSFGAAPRPTPSLQLVTNKLELLLSLDVVLELIHADREALKRVETFADYPGHYGQRVRDTIEEIFVLMLQALNERHVGPGFVQYVTLPLQ
jgi:recyclin-1